MTEHNTLMYNLISIGIMSWLPLRKIFKSLYLVGWNDFANFLTKFNNHLHNIVVNAAFHYYHFFLRVFSFFIGNQNDRSNKKSSESLVSVLSFKCFLDNISRIYISFHGIYDIR